MRRRLSRVVLQPPTSGLGERVEGQDGTSLAIARGDKIRRLVKPPSPGFELTCLSHRRVLVLLPYSPAAFRRRIKYNVPIGEM